MSSTVLQTQTSRGARGALGRRSRIDAYIAATLSQVTSGDSGVVATPTVNNSDDVSFSWALTNDAGGRFTIDSSTGVVSLVGTAEAGSFPITIEATGNPSGDVLTLNTTIVIAEGDGNWLPFTLIDGTW